MCGISTVAGPGGKRYAAGIVVSGGYSDDSEGTESFSYTGACGLQLLCSQPAAPSNFAEPHFFWRARPTPAREAPFRIPPPVRTPPGQGKNNTLGDKRQIADQELTRGNLALYNSCKDGKPVRVLRGIGKGEIGDRLMYLGLYNVKDWECVDGVDGFKARSGRERVVSRPHAETRAHRISKR